MDEIRLIAIAEQYARHRSISVARVGALAAADGKFFGRLQAGRTCTLRLANSVLQWLSDHWPADLEWPEGVARPAPAPESPAGGAAKEGADHGQVPSGGGLSALERVRREIRAMRAATYEHDLREAERRELAALEAAKELGPDGRACRQAVIEALRVAPHVYDATVARYAGGRGGVPRRGGAPARVLFLLREAGDVRFESGLIVDPDARQRADAAYGRSAA